jgi:hypothetical protein
MRTQEITEEKSPAPQAETAPSVDFAAKITTLEKQTAELRKERAQAAWNALAVTQRLDFLRRISQHFCGDFREEFRELQDALRRSYSRVEQSRITLCSCQAEFAKLHGASDEGMLILTVHGKWDSGAITLRERPANESELGAVIVEDSLPLLTKLLSRTKADPTAPKRLHVVVMPEAPFGGNARTVLKACAAAGYKAITFTGYVVSDKFSTDLQPDEYGNAPGFKWYEEVEKNPTELLKEIDDGFEKLLKAP